MKLGAFELKGRIPELNEPHVLAMLRPWVDVGSVGSLALSRIESYLGAKELGRLATPGNFFDFTRYRPMLYLKGGLRRVTIPNTVVQYAKREQGHDFLFLHLLEPHMFGEAYVDSVLKLLKKFGTKRYWLIGSMYDIVPHTKPLIVTGTATGARTETELRAAGIHASSYQGPTTIAFLISQEAPKLGIETASLIVHLPQYTELEEDYSGELRLLEVLCSLYHLPMRFDDLTQRAQRQYGQVSKAVERSPEIKAVVRQLEAYYESREKQAEQAEEKLSPEIERFLRDIQRRFG